MKLSEELRSWQRGYIHIPFDEFADKAAQLEAERDTAVKAYADECATNVYLKDEIKMLRDFYRAVFAVEEGVIDFTLHNVLVERLRELSDKLYKKALRPGGEDDLSLGS